LTSLNTKFKPVFYIEVFGWGKSKSFSAILSVGRGTNNRVTSFKVP